MVICECISSWAMSKTSKSVPSARQAVHGGTEPPSGQSDQGSQRSSGVDFRAFKVPGSATATAWKAIWQAVITRSNAKGATMPTEAEVTPVLHEFAKQVKEDQFDISSAKAPFIKVFQLDRYSTMSFTESIIAFLKEYGVGPAAEASGSRKRVRPAASNSVRRPQRRNILEHCQRSRSDTDIVSLPRPVCQYVLWWGKCLR